ncbi:MULTISPECIES: UDP-2,3-diacylglucosamine diphosphatase [Myroides]|uniref:UDP-2,3-diacylglucosamine diphosphatase n=1 Tax=Myroides albus TaxID=2562892 RepID=A0A6I3LHW0_9FLAO|nr:MULTISPECIES: UDP-2,3-diacylglucosamine diphosphatase [Myroides]MTG96740.1 UDP-2,3-diacylglucosamine diphosphatase [Myroides albus]MVX35618.1 UDP-2,3-diacylglucosamine diphosphatase [Myroides sp. LoEW2-1]UVD81288.1 UDP-2,3-diacylglucosamine diphosphatase [Myroides albus]
MNIQTNKKVYFASDQHFGAPTREKSIPREQLFLQWLRDKEHDMGALIILGDLFDFWFEYKTVVPKGFVRILGKLAEIKDRGVPVYFFVGNHDLWMDDYFQKELGIPVFHEPKIFNINGKKFFIGHGDGLGPGDLGYKRMKKVFTNKFSKWLFRWLHPDIGVRLGSYLSVKNKLISGEEDITYLGEDKEWLILYAKRKLETQHYDYFVFGHRHLPMVLDLNPNSKYVNLGDWINYFTYAVFNSNLELVEYKKEIENKKP